MIIHRVVGVMLTQTQGLYADILCLRDFLLSSIHKGLVANYGEGGGHKVVLTRELEVLDIVMGAQKSFTVLRGRGAQKVLDP